jgi:flagellar protein FlhE
MNRLPAMLTGLSALALLTASAAHAQLRVDRSFGMTRPLQEPLGPPPVPANAVHAGAPAIDDTATAAADNPHGAYAVTAVGPVIYSKNVVYTTPFPLPQPLSGRVTITNVAWKYGTQTRPAGFEAALCWKDNKHCSNVTTLGTGQTGEFNGKDATQPFKLIYQVIGTGNLQQPVYGEPAQILVTYELWR